jgi:hypothetical protein
MTFGKSTTIVLYSELLLPALFMNTKNSLKACLLTIGIVFCFGFSLESYWRSRGFSPSHNDDKVCWALKRKEVYKPAENSTVFIGSSRIKFDLDLATWRDLTGEEPVQLAIVGTSPRPVLSDLAADEMFKGKLVIDVVEGLFFSPRTFISEKSAREAVKYFHEETPAQNASARINHSLESYLTFLEEAKFGLTSMLNDLEFPSRPGVFSFPRFPKEFEVADADRQTSMTPMFLGNPQLIKKQTTNWTILGASDKTPGIKGEALETVFKEVKEAVDKIRARGGTVIFVRPPSSGDFLEMEKQVYPRQEYWDAMLKYTGTPGIHYADYPATANFVCPEWSHLAPDDVIVYTKELVKILKEEKGWRFAK